MRGPLDGMAAWQATFHLVPPGRAISETEGPDDTAPIVLTHQAKANELSIETRSSWSTTIDAWGSDDGNSFEISRENDQVTSIRVRFDLRGTIREFAKGVLSFASRNQLLFFDWEAKELFEPTPALLAAAIERSSAFRYVKDPRAFLQSLPRNAV